jgi:hypothetical protein
MHIQIKSCNDFMKHGFAAQFGERFARRLFGWLKFLSPQPRRRDFRFTPTSSGEFKFKIKLL